MLEKNDIVVSVCLVTYNHESFISEALDSILMQKVDFDYEIVVGEDCSTDNTRQILYRYKAKFPDEFKLILHGSNIGAGPNMTSVLNMCSGKYIAILEGDDYWTDPLKLQKQVNFMQNNLEYSMCFCNSENYDEDSRKVINVFPDLLIEKDISLRDLFKVNLANTCTIMCRNIGIVLPEIFLTFSLGDWPMYMLYAEEGKIKYFPDNMARYRIHLGGKWSQLDDVVKVKNTIKMLKGMDLVFDKRYRSDIYSSVRRYLMDLAYFYEKLNKSQDDGERLSRSTFNGRFKLLIKMNFRRFKLFLVLKWISVLLRYYKRRLTVL